MFAAIYFAKAKMLKYFSNDASCSELLHPAIQVFARQIEQAKSKTKVVKSDYEQLQEDYEKLLKKCNSLLVEDFELRQSIGSF